MSKHAENPTDNPLDREARRTRSIHALTKLPAFRGMANGEYEQILALAHYRTVPEGEVIFAEGDPSRCLYVLLAGRIRISTAKRGVIHLMRPGEILGETGVLCQIPRTATAIADQECVLQQIEKADFDFLLGRCPRVSSIIMKNVATVLAERLMKNNDAAPELLL